MDLVKVLTYRAQEDAGVFIGKGDSDKKEMLYQLLGLDCIDKASEAANHEFQSIEKTFNHTKATLEVLQQNLQSLRVEQAEVDKIYHEYQLVNERLITLRSIDSSNIVDQLRVFNQEIDKIGKAKMEAYSADNQVIQVKRSIDALIDEKNKVEQGICPTCQQHWPVTNERLDIYRNRLIDLQNELVKYSTVSRQAQPLIESLPHILEESKKLQEAMAAANQPKQDAERAVASAKSAYDQVCARVKRYSDAINQYNAACTHLETLSSDKIVLEHAAKIVSREGFGSVIFDDILGEIESYANNLMVDIPNVQEFVLRISSVSATKAGAVKKTISVVLYKDGQEVSLKSLSGGQRCAIDLAVDLSISAAIRRRSGLKIGWIALDEAMDGLDIDTKRATIEVVKKNVDGLLIIVDHATEIKDSFDQVINVDFDGKYSTIGG
jgi:exonuclease SbcC